MDGTVWVLGLGRRDLLMGGWEGWRVCLCICLCVYLYTYTYVLTPSPTYPSKKPNSAVRSDMI